MGAPPVLTINGWTILLHPLFIQQIAATVADVQRAQAKDPVGFANKNCTKRLKAILKLAFKDIPADPSSSSYRQGSTLGNTYTHWFRAKFFQQYRMFFRYDINNKIIIYAWVNDENTKRAYDSMTDAYSVFFDMLQAGHPPDDWAGLKKACDDEDNRRQKAKEANPAALARALLGDE